MATEFEKEQIRQALIASGRLGLGGTNLLAPAPTPAPLTPEQIALMSDPLPATRPHVFAPPVARPALGGSGLNLAGLLPGSQQGSAPTQLPKGGDTPQAWAQYRKDIAAPPGKETGGGAIYDQPPAAQDGDHDYTIGELAKLTGAGKGGGSKWVRQEAPTVGKTREAADTAAEGAIAKGAEAEKGIVQTEAQAAQEKAATMMRARQDAINAEASRQEVLQRHFAESQKIAQDVANTDTDPDSYYGQGAGSVVKRGLLMIATSLGGFSAGLRGGPNTVQDEIDKDIDRFVAGQRAEFQKKQGLLQQSNTRFGQLVAKFGDERAAESAFKADLYGAVEEHGKGMLADAKPGQIDAKAAEKTAGLAQRKYEEEDKVNKLFTAPAGPTGLQLLELQAKLNKDLREGRHTEAETAKLRAETDKTRAEAGGGASGALLSRLAPKLAATDYNPLRSVQGTEGHHHLEIHEQWNSAVIAMQPGKGFEAKEALAEPYLIRPGMTQETIDARKKAALANLGKPGAAAAAPKSFEEE